MCVHFQRPCMAWEGNQEEAGLPASRGGGKRAHICMHACITACRCRHAAAWPGPGRQVHHPRGAGGRQQRGHLQGGWVVRVCVWACVCACVRACVVCVCVYMVCVEGGWMQRRWGLRGSGGAGGGEGGVRCTAAAHSLLVPVSRPWRHMARAQPGPRPRRCAAPPSSCMYARPGLAPPHCACTAAGARACVRAAMPGAGVLGRRV